MQEFLESTNEVEDSRTYSFQKDEVETSAKNSMDFLAGLCLPEVCIFNFPDFFILIWVKIIEALARTKDFSKFAIGLPRGIGKSTVIKILTIYTILFTERQFILIVCASATLAENIVADIIGILDTLNIINCFGNFRNDMKIDRQDLKKFYYRDRNIIIAGLGAGSSVRGLNIDNVRPDLILMDDIQTAKQAESETVSRDFIRWFQGTLLKAGSKVRCTYIFIGNMYPDLKIGGSTSNVYTCLLRNLQTNPNWLSLITGGLISNLEENKIEALWPEIQSVTQLLAELEDDISMGCPEVFYSEVQNDPSCGLNNNFDLSKLPAYNVDEDLDILMGKFLIIDPSLGKKKSDAQIVIYYEVWDSIPVCKEVIIKQVSAPELVKWCLKFAGENGIPLIVAETAAYQGTLLQWFEHYANEIGYEGTDFLPVAPGGRTKNGRILSMFKSWLSNDIKIHPHCLSQVLSQVSIFDPLRQTNTDDILDNLSYAPDVMLNYPNELILPEILQLQVDEVQSIEENNCVF